jgi:hypothetical protein
MMSVLVPSLVGFALMLGVFWTGFRLLLPGKVTQIIALAFILVWVLFACNLMMAFLN